MIDALSKVRRAIESKYYKKIRLVRLNKDGTEEIIDNWQKVDNPNFVKRFEFVASKIQYELPEGIYRLQGTTTITRGGKVDNYQFEVRKNSGFKYPELSEKIEDHTKKAKTMQREITIDEYISIISENERLKSQNALLMAQLEIEQNKQPLSEAPTLAEKAFEGLKDIIPHCITILDKYFENQDRKLSIEEKKLKPVQALPLRENRVKREGIKDYDYYVNLSNSNPTQFDREFDLLEDANPALFDRIGNDLSLFEDEESLTSNNDQDND